MRVSGNRSALLLSSALAGALFLSGMAAAQSVPVYQFDIPAQKLSKALKDFSEAASQQIVFSDEIVGDRSAPSLRGAYTRDQALSILLEGTGLRADASRTGVIMIRKAIAANGTNAGGAVLATGSQARVDVEPKNEGESSSDGPQTSSSLEKVTVTGTRIRGKGPTGSPVTTYDQKDFDRAGSATLQQFIGTLPQNFGGGANEDTSTLSTTVNTPFGSAVNLRGLGSSSTLVLINGRRSAVSGTAEFVDISMIPLSAVARVEVLTDGASAIYGSDAVGGVVNIIMRDNYEGAETRFRGGSSTEGGAEDFRGSQTLGHTWSSGNVLASYEHYFRDALSSTQRDFSSNTTTPGDGPIALLPKQKKDSLYVAGTQELSDSLQISGDALVSQRNAEFDDWDPFALLTGHSSSENKQMGGSAQLRAQIGEAWQARLQGVASRNKLHIDQTSDGFTATTNSTYDLWSTDAIFDGPLFSLAAGEVRTAFGATHREETFESADNFSSLSNDTAESAVFGELVIPILGPSDSLGGKPRLTVGIAGRYEHYDLFGDSFDPKYGIELSVTRELTLRGTYGTSFKAPSLYQSSDFNTVAAPLTLPDPLSPTGTTRVIFRLGNSTDLGPETAENQTFGIDYAPSWLKGFRTRLTYYNIKYDDRIGVLLVGPVQILSDATYADLLTRRGAIPDPQFDALVARLLSGQDRIPSCALPLGPDGSCPEPVSNFGAVIDRRLRNIASTQTSGIDTDLSSEFVSDDDKFSFNLNLNYIFDFKERVSRAQPLVEFVDTRGHPTDFRARFDATWTRGVFAVGFSVNYTDDYFNRGAFDPFSGDPIPTEKVASWTTCDLNLRYDSHDESSGPFSGVSLTLNVSNVFDNDPPFFDDRFLGLGYDPVSADPLGRFVSLEITKRW